MSNKITDPKEQLEKLVSCQAAWESFLHTLTGLTVKVSLTVHSTSNPEADLLQLFEASIAMPEFEQQNTSRKTWIAHTDLSRNICIFMPDNFNDPYPYPEPEDDEGYNLAVENAHANRMLSPEGQAIEAASRRAEGQLKRNDDKIPF